MVLLGDGLQENQSLLYGKDKICPTPRLVATLALRVRRIFVFA